jgi:S-DNA-T family DNA segregation ATPase FtsK/SpoIIIE
MIDMGRRRRYRRKKLLSFNPSADTVYTTIFVLLLVVSVIITISFFNQSSMLLQYIADLTYQLFGPLRILFPLLLLSVAFLFIRWKLPISKANVALGFFLIFISLLGLSKAGNMGNDLWTNSSYFITSFGAYTILVAALVIGLALIFNTSLDQVAFFIVDTVKMIGGTLKRLIKKDSFSKPVISGSTPDMPLSKTPIRISGIDQKQEGTKSDQSTALALPQKSGLMGLDESSLVNKPEEVGVWEYPPISLLSESHSKNADPGDYNKNAQTIEMTLDSFGISSKVREVHFGPAVTQYAVEIAKGIKLSKVTALSTDLALALAAPTGQIRIEAPIPGKSLVGVEVPNKSLRIVTLKEMLLSPEMRQSTSKLSVALGLDVGAKKMVMDIASMPHILVAGTTGSGKSVMINSLIASLLFRTTPAEVRLILIDPKRVEMTNYDGLPNLYHPVITDTKETLKALQWSVSNMEQRYKMFQKANVRHIEAYNQTMGYQALPYIVIFIDELADLMLYAPTEVENAITRIAQMARATGIHLVISTQRPSVNVITGLIKANIPCRISFNVSSMVDSRVILDTPGAEKLLGKGDMLFIPPTQSKPIRVQGTFVSDNEIKALVDFIKTNTKNKGIPIQYTEEISSQEVTITHATGLMETTEGRDPLFEEAKRIVIASNTASASMLQRKLKIGFSRAGRLLDQLHEAGIVGPAQGSKSREITYRPDM